MSNNKTVSKLSVFFPAYNEEGNIAQTVKKAVNVLKTSGLEWEILIINDGSTDNTAQVAQEISKKYQNVKVINQPNGGYGCALRSGFTNSSYDWIVYTDGDGQFDFAEISKFLEKTDQADLILGYRIKRADPIFRSLFAKGWAISLFFFFGLWLKDVDCGFKMVSKRLLEKIPPLVSSRGGMINAELAIKAKKFGFRIAQVGVNHYPRKFGTPTGASIRVIFQSYLDLLKLWWKLK